MGGKIDQKTSNLISAAALSFASYGTIITFMSMLGFYNFRQEEISNAIFFIVAAFSISYIAMLISFPLHFVISMVRKKPIKRMILPFFAGWVYLIYGQGLICLRITGCLKHKGNERYEFDFSLLGVLFSIMFFLVPAIFQSILDENDQTHDESTSKELSDGNKLIIKEKK